MLEAAERLRLAAVRLQQDLAGVTVTMNPPRDPANNEGYFEYIEGTATATSSIAVNTDNGSAVDTTVGDFDDILMFTTRTTGRPFVGKCATAPNGTIQSDVAEVAWFIRGRNLHRRVLLVAPGAFTSTPQVNFYTNYDISVHTIPGTTNVAPNTLGDLTRRECRFAHIGSFPYDVSTSWNWTSSGYTFPTLPTLDECSGSASTTLLPVTTPPYVLSNALDFWTNASGHRVADNAFTNGVDGTRVADDVILTNVIGFDVKAWDPQYVDPVTGVTGGYVDLGYTPALGRFAAANYSAVGRVNGVYLQNHVYDTWSTHYESVGTFAGDPNAGRALNGLDDQGDNPAGTGSPPNGIVDDAQELLTSPPYPYPLRGIQVKIRIFEPDSRQIREVTVVQDFLPQ
jgi:hypothetical protein